MRALLILLLAAPAAWAKGPYSEQISRLNEADLPTQITAARKMGRAEKSKDKDEVVTALLRRLDVKRASPRLTAAIIESLGKLKDPRALDPLLGVWDFLSSAKLQMGAELPPNLQLMRAQVVEAVGEIGTQGAAPLLELAISDADPLVQQKAAVGLGAIGDKNSVEALVALLERGGNLAQAAFESLGKLNDSRARSALERYLKAEESQTQAQAAYALAIGDRTYATTLAHLMRDERTDPMSRILAAYYLARLGDRAGVEYLSLRASKGKPSEQARAIEALGKCGHKNAAAVAADLLDSPDANTRMLAARALGRLGGGRAEAALRRLLNDKNAAVKTAARQALEEL
jgi:HEAT repeat protein